VREIMSASVIVVDPDRPVAEAARIMTDHKIGALPVVDGTRLAGIITESDFVRAVASGDVRR
jgi:CBS domain-containing membrane protein